VEGLEVESTRTPWTTGGLHRDSTRISGGVINTARGTQYPAQAVLIFGSKSVPTGNRRSHATCPLVYNHTTPTIVSSASIAVRIRRSAQVPLAFDHHPVFYCQAN